MYVFLFIHVYIYIYMCIFICICVYIYMYLFSNVVDPLGIKMLFLLWFVTVVSGCAHGFGYVSR